MDAKPGSDPSPGDKLQKCASDTSKTKTRSESLKAKSQRRYNHWGGGCKECANDKTKTCWERLKVENQKRYNHWGEGCKK